MNLDRVVEALEAKDRKLLYEILMEPDDRPYNWNEAEELLDDLCCEVLRKELLENEKLLDAFPEDSLEMRKYHRGLTRALKADGELGRLARRYICEEIAKFKESRVG